MADVLTKSQRYICMSRIRSRDTVPEIELRKALWAIGLRYRLKSRLPGNPDLVFPSLKSVVFVDGCFWHVCPQHGVRPSSNTEFWQNKLDSNVARDKAVNRKLKRLGWRVVRVWEHEIDADSQRAAELVYRRLTKRSSRE
jgi:DNA mismatch endonuclease, patch repair protein